MTACCFVLWKWCAHMERENLISGLSTYLWETHAGASSLRVLPLQWLDSASWSMGLGCRMLQNSLCGALVLKGGQKDRFDLLCLDCFEWFNCDNPSGEKHCSFNARPAQQAGKDQALLRHLRKLPRYIRWCLKFIIGVLMWKDELKHV